MSELVRVPWKGWKVVSKLGQGSYGTVYEIERTVGSHVEKAAMKVIPIPPDRQVISEYRNEGYDDNSITQMCELYLNRTVEEYTMMRSMKENNNIVSCDDIEYLLKEDSIGWEVYIRMELLTPFSKSHVLDSFDEKEVIRLGKDICNALASCEDRDVVHRDVKPDNIFISRKGTYKLGDFGVARTLEHTTAATKVGTEKFMAPEVIKREKYGNNVDLYSLGLVLYWLLNERRMPFLIPGKASTPDQQTDAYYRRLSGEDLPEPKNGSQALKKVVLKACAYDRFDRYQSAREMILALEAAERGSTSKEPEPVAVPSEESSGAQWKSSGTIGVVRRFDAEPDKKGPSDSTMKVDVDDRPETETISTWDNIKTKIRKHKGLAIGIAAALLVLIVAIVGISVIVGGSKSKDSNAANTIKTTLAGKEASKLTTEKKKKETTTTAPRTTVKTTTTKASGGLFSRRTTKKTTKKKIN